ERAPEGLPVIRVDLATHRRHFAEASERFQTWSMQRRTTPPGLEIQQLRELQELLPAFVEEIADHIVESLAPDASQEEVTELVNVAIDWELWGDDDSTTGSRGLDKEIGRIAELARGRLTRRKSRDGWESDGRVAHLVRARGPAARGAQARYRTGAI